MGYKSFVGRFFVFFLVVHFLLITGYSVLAKRPYELVIDPSLTHQTIEGFGASDAWNCDEVGRYWPDNKKEAIAELLFSTENTSNGRPAGIGLSRWRFNVGAGSTEQGEDSQIVNPHRRVECFLRSDGTYDWSKQEGQQWFLRKAAEYGVEHRIMFSNSPPVYFTKNGLAHGSGGFSANLSEEAYDDYAEFLARVLMYFDETGLSFNEISPVNEPQWEWKSDKQEGSPWLNHEIAKVVRELDQALISKGLEIPISITEAGAVKYLYEANPQRDNGDQIEEFFSQESPNYVGDLQNVPSMICGHSYWSVYTNEMLLETRNRVKQVTEEFGLKYHQSEYSLIGLNNIRDHKPETEWEIAMFIAKVIHTDLTVANASVWSFWTALADKIPAVKNRYALITLENRYPWGDEEPTFEATKTLWALGHYSRFIRPGFKRIDVSGLEPVGDLCVSAFLNEATQEVIVVMLNLSEEPQEYELSFSGEENLELVETYLTNDRTNFMSVPILDPMAKKASVDPKSLVTRVFRIAN